MQKNANTLIRILISVFLVVMTISTGVFAAEEKRVGLREAVKTAIENNHELKAFSYSLSAQQEDIGIARSYLLPKITFEERFMRTANPTYAFMAKLNQERFSQEDFAITSLNSPAPINDFQTSFSFEQPLFARKATIGLDMAKAEYSAKGEEFARKKQEIAQKTARAYFAVITAEEYVRAIEAAVSDAKEHSRISEKRYNAGLGLYSDTLRAATALADAEQKLVSARKNLEVSKRALGFLLGTTDSIEAADKKIDLPLMDIEYYREASLSRKDIRSLEEKYKNAKNNLRFAEAGYFPTLGIGGSYQLNDHRVPFGSEGDSWQLLAFLKWNLFDGTKREHERKKALYKISETEEYIEGLKKAASFGVYEAYLGVEEAKKNVELSRSALKTAEEGTRLVAVRYENSLSPLVDLLDAQANLDHAKANLIARENDYQLTLVNLGYESGTILKDLGIE